MPARVVHDCVTAQVHLSVEASPVIGKRKQSPGNYRTPLGSWHICFNLCGYVAGSETAWHMSNRTYIQHNKIIPEHPGKLPQHAVKY